MPIKEAFKEFEIAAQETAEWFREEMTKIRTGRVTTRLLEGIFVESYGTRTPLNGVASITSSDARTLLISPWDPSVIPSIQKSLTEAQLGAMPAVDGRNVRLSFPMLNEEMRNKSVKMLHAKAEEARVRLRRARDEALSQLQQEKKDGDLTEDDFYKGKEGLDKKIDEANKELAEKIKNKETEITTI